MCTAEADDSRQFQDLPVSGRHHFNTFPLLSHIHCVTSSCNSSEQLLHITIYAKLVQRIFKPGNIQNTVLLWIENWYMECFSTPSYTTATHFLQWSIFGSHYTNIVRTTYLFHVMPPLVSGEYHVLGLSVRPSVSLSVRSLSVNTHSA